MDHIGNMPVLPAIFPNLMAPLVRPMLDGQRELLMMQWGFPAPNVRPKKPRNSYLTNVRKTNSRYWQSYLENPGHRCLVPVTRFAEPGKQGPHCIWTWFAHDETRPLMFFGGIWLDWKATGALRPSPILANIWCSAS